MFSDIFKGKIQEIKFLRIFSKSKNKGKHKNLLRSDSRAEGCLPSSLP